MPADLPPLYRLVIGTPRLRLRLPREAEVAELAELAGRGVHRPGERPFLTPWTDGGHAERARSVWRDHWYQLATWSPTAWTLGLGVFHDGQPLGVVALRGTDFAVTRQVSSWSWLGLEHHGQGFGTEAREGLLALAFDHLGATAAVSEVFQDNAASQAVSRKLGYRKEGIAVDARDGEALVSDRLRLTVADWRARDDRPPVTVDGLDACRAEFAVPRPAG